SAASRVSSPAGSVLVAIDHAPGTAHPAVFQHGDERAEQPDRAELRVEASQPNPVEDQRDHEQDDRGHRPPVAAALAPLDPSLLSHSLTSLLLCRMKTLSPLYATASLVVERAIRAHDPNDRVEHPQHLAQVRLVIAVTALVVEGQDQPVTDELLHEPRLARRQ